MLTIKKEDAQKIVDLAESGEEIPIAAFMISFRELTQAEKEWARTLVEA